MIVNLPGQVKICCDWCNASYAIGPTFQEAHSLWKRRNRGRTFRNELDQWRHCCVQCDPERPPLVRAVVRGGFQEEDSLPVPRPISKPKKYEPPKMPRHWGLTELDFEDDP